MPLGSDVVTSTARPLTTLMGLAMLAPFTVNCTVPVAPVGETVAVNVTLRPKVVEVVLLDSDVVLLTGFTISVNEPLLGR